LTSEKWIVRLGRNVRIVLRGKSEMSGTNAVALSDRSDQVRGIEMTDRHRRVGSDLTEMNGR
jgi:hypothetical protein